MITKLVIANRGEIARRIMRTAHEMGIGTVAVYAEADASAPFVTEATEAFHLPNDSYLDQDGLLAIAVRAGADAVHPGYGFLSESAAFARSVLAAGLTWVGPRPEAIAAMGDKLAAKTLAAEAGVPTLPTTESWEDVDGLEFPLLIKAVAGGGGKGMRVLETRGQLAEAVPAAQREALSAFGDERIFLERFVPSARHIEIQVLGDKFGNLVHLGERECSIQRRHQKVIEEAPSPVVDPPLRDRMTSAALRLAGALGYDSVGTVEFLVDDRAGPDGCRPFWFLEVNTRLQVEHAVTEAVTGLDLVREQLRAAMGEPLPFEQCDVAFTGHAIEARLYAEDPAAGFVPATGTLEAWEPAGGPSLRFDSGVEAGTVVGVQFDPLLAKVIAWAPDRPEAVAKLARGLEQTLMAGLTTNRDFLVATLRSTAFIDGETTTDFIDRVRPAARREISPDDLDRAATAVGLWEQGCQRREARCLAFMPSGWRNGRLPAQQIVVAHGEQEIAVTYQRRRDGAFLLAGERIARLHAWTEDGVDFEVDDRRFAARIVRFGEQLVVHGSQGAVTFDLRPRFPAPTVAAPSGGLTASMPGTVVAVYVDVGQKVTAGEVLLVLEAMKMEHQVTAPLDGVVEELLVAAGDQVQNGAVLILFEQ